MHDQPDYGTLAQQAAERHLEAVWEAEAALEDAEDDADLAAVDSPAFGLFDGCTSCVVRETLHAAWPVFEQSTISRLVDAGYTDAAAFLAGPDPD